MGLKVAQEEHVVPKGTCLSAVHYASLPPTCAGGSDVYIEVQEFLEAANLSTACRGALTPHASQEMTDFAVVENLDDPFEHRRLFGR